jgi:hypothetical protein
VWLVLCGTDDLPALWAFQGLGARGLAPLELVSAPLLAYSLRWEHRLDGNGAGTVLTLADGRTLQCGEVRGTLNRLHTLPFEHLDRAAPGDREYARTELLALFASWLYALPPPVFNRPTPEGLAGRGRHLSEWVWLAARAGLPTLPYAESSDPAAALAAGARPVPPFTPLRTVFVVAGRAVGEAPGIVLEGCLRLSDLAGTALLGIDFAATPFAGPWTFAGASPFPDLRLGGPALLDALKDALTRRERSAA